MSINNNIPMMNGNGYYGYYCIKNKREVTRILMLSAACYITKPDATYAIRF